MNSDTQRRQRTEAADSWWILLGLLAVPLVLLLVKICPERSGLWKIVLGLALLMVLRACVRLLLAPLISPELPEREADAATDPSRGAAG